MNLLLYPIVVPVLSGILCWVVPGGLKRVREILALLCSFTVFGLTIWLFIQGSYEWTVSETLVLRMDALSRFVLLACGFFGFLITLYSVRFMENNNNQSVYYSSLLLTLGAACGAVLANHLLVLLVFWGFLGITLYLLILTGGEGSAAAAKKTLTIVGGSDAVMLLGIALIYTQTSSFEMHTISLQLNSTLTIVIFACFLIAAFAKAGSVPFHSWIPDMAATSPIPVTAFLPSALDKILGIYLLGRICLNMFQVTGAANLLLMLLGSLTIVAAVLRALGQHDLKKLLAFHAISQVGYMVLGIGTGNPIGIIGGLFHMLNNTVYKTCLFLSGGAVQQRTGTTHLDRLGGLARMMPVTFASFLIAALAISGIPPLNGFVSKWMIYQSLFELGKQGHSLWVVWLVAAMFGSGLTLASFMKLIHSVFLGIPSGQVQSRKVKEVGVGMLLPIVVLALLCVVFGVFAYTIPLKHLLLPVIPGLQYIGIWSPGFSTTMILIGIVIGILIYLIGNMRIKTIREAGSFIGGEQLPVESRVTGTGFYTTIKKIPFVNAFYKWDEENVFDIYEQSGRISSGFANLFKRMHTGILTMYMVWMLSGLFILFILLMGR